MDTVKVLSIPQRVFTHKDFAAYIMAESENAEESNREEVSLQTIVNSDENFTNFTSSIYNYLISAFETVDEYIEVFQPFRATFLANAEYVETVRTAYKGSELKEIAEAIAKYRGQAQEFDGIPFSATIGILFVDSKDMKMMLMPSPVRCLYAIQKLLPELMNEAARSLIGELGRVLPVVMGVPNTVEEFVKKKKMVEEAQQNIESYKSRQAHVEEMAALMKSQSWAIPEEQRSNLLIIGENITTLENGVQVRSLRRPTVDSLSRH
jgi:dynein heavy chain, axonemal